MKFLKLLLLAYARADEEEEEVNQPSVNETAVDDSGVTPAQVNTVIEDNVVIQEFINSNRLTFNFAEGECDEVSETFRSWV